MPTLTVRRDKGYADKLRAYSILLDGDEIGRLDEGAVLQKEIGTGRHVLEAKIDWCSSAPLQFEAQTGEYLVLVHSALRRWRVLLGLFYIIFSRRRYLVLLMQ